MGENKPVAWTVVDSNEESSIGGWQSMESYETSRAIAVLREGHSYRFAISETDYRQVVASLNADHERETGELTSQVHELERLCDATYVAQGADAYNYACDLIEQLQSERIAKGRVPGTEKSLCDGLTWAYGELLESEDEIEALRHVLAASRAEVEGLKNMVRVMQNNPKFDFDAAIAAMKEQVE